jgi:hypothetical protein
VWLIVVLKGQRISQKRIGKTFRLGADNKHFLKTEFSVSKYLSSESLLQGNGNNLDRVNSRLDNLQWEDVFKPCGYVAGFGIVLCLQF